MFKQNTAFLLVAFLIFLLFTEKFNFLKKKEIWIALLIFSIILSPYLIWGYMKFGGFVLTQGQEEVAPEIIKIGYDNLKTYLIESPQYISRIFLIIFILGLVSFYKLFIGFDILIKNKDNNNELKRDLYVLLLLIIPIVLIGFLLNHPEPRYIMNGFPAVFMILGFIIFKGYVFIKQKSKLFAAICLIFLLCFFVYIQIFGAGYSDSLIKDKMNSYWEVREAGLWLADNSNPEDVIVTNSIHQIAYYANRNTIIPPANETVFEFMLQSNKTLKYLVVSLIQQSPDWAYTYPTEKKLEVANAYFADLEQQQPVLIIYKLGNQSTYS